MNCAVIFLSHLELKRIVRRVGLYHDFPRRGWVVQVPRILGSQQGWILWQEASPVLLDFFPPFSRCCWKRKFCTLPSVLQGFILLQDPVVLSGTPFIAYFTRIAGYAPQAVLFTSRVSFNVRFTAYSLPQPGHICNSVLRTWVCLQIPWV